MLSKLVEILITESTKFRKLLNHYNRTMMVNLYLKRGMGILNSVLDDSTEQFDFYVDNP